MSMQQDGSQAEPRQYNQRAAVQLVCPEPTRTKQEMQDECNINNIISKWEITGELQHTAANPPVYGDFDSQIEFQDAMNQVIAAKATFMELPSKIRRRFNNDAGELIAFTNDPANEAEGIELGIYNDPSKEVDPERVPSPPAPIVPTPSASPPGTTTPIIGGEDPPTS